MKRISLIRVLLLLSLFTVGIFCLFAIPMDDSATWYSDFFISKAVATGCLWRFGKLYERWKKTDSWVRAYDRWNTIKS